MKHYLFENFDYTFFPCLYDIEIRLKSSNVSMFNTFGTPDNDKVFENNNFSKKGIEDYLVTQIPTLFPSELEYAGDDVLTHGGLILVKTIPK